MKLATLINQLADEDTSALKTLSLVVDWIRPQRSETVHNAVDRMKQLENALTDNLDVHLAVAGRLQEWLDQAQFFQLLSGLGLYSRRGFLKEIGERLYERINPAPKDRNNVKSVLFVVFHRKDDADWIHQIPDEALLRLLTSLWHFSPPALDRTRNRIYSQMLNALEMLSIWVAAEELEPNILRLNPKIIDRESAFVALQREIAALVQSWNHALQQQQDVELDDAHARVLIEQCREEIDRLQRRSVTAGSTMALTHLLERLHQTLDRIEHLLDIMDPPDPAKGLTRSVELFKSLVQASAERHGVRSLWRANLRLMSRSVTENASDHGEHYIAGSRKEYLTMLASGAGGGFIIALMALIKIQILQLDLSRGWETLWVSLNYGIGFMVIHMLHCTVATKQPAMTAASIAEKVEQGEQGRANARKLAELLVRVGRTQFVAIMGNVAVALSVAFGIGWLYTLIQGAPLISTERYDYMLAGIHPGQSLALMYAAIAGVWLFVSGLVAGYFDNRAAYLNLAERLEQHPMLRPLMPPETRARFGAYVAEHYGALASNFVFGILLGVTGYIGHLLGLPIDIRHVAFSSADVGYAMSMFIPGAQEFALFTLFALLIGGVNLMVSFTLALNVALRARNTRISSFPKLIKAWFMVVKENPMALIYPPRDPAPAPTEEVGPEPTPEQTRQAKADNKERRQKALEK
ncbi:site-specific recombinase [Marinobacter halophilus]|uniref:Recombinase n=1 Tax=Marinobacter halophilus TaxID=1323740 RepID=A0A2T1KIU3_9GAMM|nr:site-specific recombinase [Marinobacter halophilus]PSF10039.1 recombinase [Marinobacter halophilus]GGC67212.1 recombinase [Marinobacter halophilus]